MGRRALSAQEKADRAVRERNRGRQRRLDAGQNGQTHRPDSDPNNTNDILGIPTSSLSTEITTGRSTVLGKYPYLFQIPL
jgi:hypothetical protein